MFDHLDDPLEFAPTNEFRTRVKDRGRRLQRRRRLTAAAATTAALASALAAVLLLGPATNDDAGSDVRTGNSTSTTTMILGPPVVVTSPPVDPTTEPTMTEGRGMTITPSSGLKDGDTITLDLEQDVSGEVLTGLCAVEALEFLRTGDRRAAQNLCSVTTTGQPTMQVSRLIERDRVIDCASAPGRCIAAAALGADSPYAPLVFEVGDPPGVESQVEAHGASQALGDGDSIYLIGRGFGPNVEVTVRQCRKNAWAGCNNEERTRVLTTDASGRFSIEYTVYETVWRLGGPGEGEERPCDPCELHVQSPNRSLVIPIRMVSE